jgi:hypothetical protein
LCVDGDDFVLAGDFGFGFLRDTTKISLVDIQLQKTLYARCPTETGR